MEELLKIELVEYQKRNNVKNMVRCKISPTTENSKTFYEGLKAHVCLHYDSLINTPSVPLSLHYRTQKAHIIEFYGANSKGQRDYFLSYSLLKIKKNRNIHIQ